MNAVLRHFAVRLWLAATLGSLTGILWLPAWQRFLGVEWLWLAAAATLAITFAVVGWCMNRLGLFLLRRQIREAAVFERAGMDRQARASYDRVAALFDSFWLSPLQRRRSDRLAAGQMIRYHLAQAELSPVGRRILAAYFQRNPRDAAAAERWLEHLLEQGHHLPDEHDAATRVGDSLPNLEPVQRLLMRFYLASGRTDFSALQTYRRIWRVSPEPSAEETIRLARLLLTESLLNDWALEVYLKAYAAGATECLEGIRAAVRMLRPGSANRTALAQARAVCAAAGTAAPSLKPYQRAAVSGGGPALEHHHTSEPVRLEQPEAPRTSPAQHAFQSDLRGTRPDDADEALEPESKWRFQVGPPDDAPEVEESPESPHAARFAAYPLILGRAALGLGRRLASGLRRSSDGLARAAARSNFGFPAAAAVRRAAIAATVTAAVVVIAVAGWRYLGRQSGTVAESPAAESAPPAVTDPFTIQVAAYVRAEDALRFTERLRKNGLDAFHSMATSANRKWYQVKVSHFATRAQAREFGEQLKAKGLIDDFYVANYQPGDALPTP